MGRNKLGLQLTCRFRIKVPIKVPTNVPTKMTVPTNGPDSNILFDFQNILLGLTKTSFFSNFLTERARQV